MSNFLRVTKDEAYAVPVLALIMAFAFALRLFVVYQTQSYLIESDLMFGYEMGEIAASLANGEGFRHEGVLSVWMPPVYPFILSLFFRVLGIFSQLSAVGVIVFQVLLSVCSAGLVYRIGRKITTYPRALFGGALWSIYPLSLIQDTQFIWSASLELFVVCLLLLTLLNWAESLDHPFGGIFFGLTSGFAALVNPYLVATLPIAILYTLFQTPNQRWVNSIFPFLIIFSAMTAPWVIRHYLIFDRFVPIEGRFGINLWLGNEPGVSQQSASKNKWDRLEDHYSSEIIDDLWSLTEADRNIYLRNEALYFIQMDPVAFVLNSFRRLGLFWTNSIRSMTVVSVGMFLFSIIGISHNFKGSFHTRLLTVFCLFFPIVYLVTVANLYRFRYPIEGVLIVFAGIGILDVYNKGLKLFQSQEPLTN